MTTAATSKGGEGTVCSVGQPFSCEVAGELPRPELRVSCIGVCSWRRNVHASENGRTVGACHLFTQSDEAPVDYPSLRQETTAGRYTDKCATALRP